MLNQVDYVRFEMLKLMLGWV